MHNYYSSTKQRYAVQQRDQLRAAKRELIGWLVIGGLGFVLMIALVLANS